MTFSFSSSLTRGSRFWRLPGLGLVAALAVPTYGMGVSSHRGALSEHRSCDSFNRSETPQAYLLLLGPTAFRFAPPPPAPVERPASIASAPVNKPTEAASAPENSSPTTPANTPAASNPANPAGAKILPVLPDDTPGEVRAEDVLPYFQLPKGDGSHRSVIVPFTPAAPASPALPQSSASYELK